MTASKQQKKRFNIIGTLIPLVILATIFIFGGLYNARKREHLRGIWLMPVNGKVYLFTFSSMVVGGKSAAVNYHFRLIDPETGKVDYKRKITVRYRDVTMHCITPTSIWISKGNELNCLEFPTFKTRWNKSELNTYLEKTYTEIGKVYETKYVQGNIKVTNTGGNEFTFPVSKFEKNDNGIVFIPGDNNELGSLTHYIIPIDAKPQQIEITVETEGDKKPEVDAYMSLGKKLELDTGFARSYAVFAPDSTCMFFDGNKLRTLKKLVNDSVELIWAPLFKGKTWLGGDMLRPYKGYSALPESRFMNTYKNICFVHYQTSLVEKENKSRLAGIDYKQEKIIWDIDLSTLKIKRAERPEQNFVFNTTLITVWKNNSGHGVITGIDVGTGNVIWRIRQ